MCHMSQSLCDNKLHQQHFQDVQTFPIILNFKTTWLSASCELFRTPMFTIWVSTYTAKIATITPRFGACCVAGEMVSMMHACRFHLVKSRDKNCILWALVVELCFQFRNWAHTQSMTNLLSFRNVSCYWLLHRYIFQMELRGFFLLLTF